MRRFFEAPYPYSGSRGSLAPAPSDYVDVRVLAAGAPERHTIPAGAAFVLMSADGDFYARFGDSSALAAIPADDVTDGSASELNPAARRIPASVTTIALVAPVATRVTLSFYAA